jgi:hypothetical protein
LDSEAAFASRLANQGGNVQVRFVGTGIDDCWELPLSCRYRPDMDETLFANIMVVLILGNAARLLEVMRFWTHETLVALSSRSTCASSLSDLQEPPRPIDGIIRGVLGSASVRTSLLPIPAMMGGSAPRGMLRSRLLGWLRRARRRVSASKEARVKRRW